MGEKHIAIYCRVSSDKQSTASQKPDLDRWIAAYVTPDTPVLWYEDTSNDHVRMDREAWNRLEAACEAGHVEKIVVWKLDRLGRSAGKLHELFQRLRQWDVKFVSLKESLDLDTPAGRLMAGILASLAEYELEQSSMRIRAGLARKLATGWRPSGRKTRTKLTKDKLRQMKRMIREGIPVASVAEAVGVTDRHVRRVMEQLGLKAIDASQLPPVKREKPHTKITDGHVRALRNMVAAGEPKTKIAQVLGCSRKHVYDLIKVYCPPSPPNELPVASE